MSNSDRHADERRERAEQKAKEGREHRNALRKTSVASVPELAVQKLSWWRRFLRWLKWHIVN